MKTVLLINEEKYWKDYFDGFNIVQNSLQTSEFIVKNSSLYAVDAKGVCKPDVIFWRLGAVNPDSKHLLHQQQIRLISKQTEKMFLCMVQ
jgi:ribosomal protein S6--L-glutamate ligase